eukprot:2672009-Rhodomonas_salina.1
MSVQTPDAAEFPKDCVLCFKNVFEGRTEESAQTLTGQGGQDGGNTNEQTLEQFLKVAVEKKMALPVYEGNHRKFVDAVHAFSLECQLLLPEWPKTFEQNKKVARPPPLATPSVMPVHSADKDTCCPIPLPVLTS